MEACHAALGSELLPSEPRQSVGTLQGADSSPGAGSHLVKTQQDCEDSNKLKSSVFHYSGHSD